MFDFVKLDWIAVLEFGIKFATLALSSLAVELECATSSSALDAYLNEVRDPDGRMIGFSSPIALPLAASVTLIISSWSKSDRLLF